MGAIDEKDAPGNAWRSAANWPVPATDTSFYFHADLSMALDKPQSADAAVEYI
jgi:predicted acyl esterase